MLFPLRFPSLALCLAILCCGAKAEAHPTPLNLPPGTSETINHIYSFELDAGIQGARQIQRDQPDHPIGYLLEGEALWWRTWCLSADFKVGTVAAPNVSKDPGDRKCLVLPAKAYTAARALIERGGSAEMQFYAGLADALAARLYGLRGENRATARVGV